MNKVIYVKALNDYKLYLEFDNSESRIFDVNPYLEYGIFKELKNINYFDKVRVNFDSISWENGQDFSPETLYLKGEEVINLNEVFTNQE